MITNFGVNDTLKVTSGSLKSVSIVGADAIVSLAGAKYSGRVTLAGAGDYDFNRSGNVLTVKHAAEPLTNARNDVTFSGTGGADYMINSGSNVTINAGGGDDTIEGASDGSELFRFGAADGNDVICNFGINDTLRVTSGNITNYYAEDGDYIIEVTGTSSMGSVTLKNVDAINVSGKNVRATRVSAQLSSDEYWFEQDASDDELGDLLGAA